MSETGGITGPIFIDTEESLAQQRADQSLLQEITQPAAQLVRWHW